MTYTPPPKADFIEIYPSFAAVSDPAYTFWSTQAANAIGHFEDCLGDRMGLAGMLAIAHYLTKAGIGTGTEAQIAAEGASGFKSIRSGSLSLERSDASAIASGGEWGATSFGQQLWPMLKACVGGPIVSSTGYVGGNCGYNGFAGPLPTWQV